MSPEEVIAALQGKRQYGRDDPIAGLVPPSAGNNQEGLMSSIIQRWQAAPTQNSGGFLGGAADMATSVAKGASNVASGLYDWATLPGREPVHVPADSYTDDSGRVMVKQGGQLVPWQDVDPQGARAYEDDMRARSQYGPQMAMGMMGGTPFRGAPAGSIGMGAGAAKRVSEALPMDEASRLSRAQAQGFRPNMPLSFGLAPEGEQIASAAINVNGRIFSGASHFDAVQQAEQVLGIPFEKMQHSPIVDGFTTNAGRFVSRYEAGHIAGGPQQGVLGMHSDEGLLSSGAGPTSPVRTGATAPGLPGGQGVWGALAPEAQQEGVLWHRAARPAVMDAQGAQTHEIQASLADAWDRGHDAVMLRNYTRPGADAPENIVVVRDKSQLRSPNAAFNPANRDSGFILGSGATDKKLGAAIGGLSQEHEITNLLEQVPGIQQAKDIERQGGWTLDSHVPQPKALAAGFDQPAYHGTHWFEGQKVRDEFFSTPDPELASLYAGPEWHGGQNGKILPLLLKTKDYHTFDAAGKTWSQVNSDAIAAARDKGAPGVRINNVWDEPSTKGYLSEPKTVFISLEPSTVRSRFANFDPAKMHLNDLLASGVATAVPASIAANAMTGNQDQSDTVAKALATPPPKSRF